MANNKAKKEKSTGLVKPEGKPGKPDRTIEEGFKNYMPPRAAGKFHFGGGLVAHTPAIEPRGGLGTGTNTGNNPNLNNAQKTRPGRDVFLKDISYGNIKTTTGTYSKDFALQWNEPSNLEYSIADVPVKKADSRGIWMRDMESKFKFTNLCERDLYLQMHVPLASVTDPKNASWKVQNVVKTLKPGKSFTYTRRVTPASRVSPKKSKTFTDATKCLAADLLEFRVNIEDLKSANKPELRDEDAILRIESGSISDRGHFKEGICYQVLDFLPKDSKVHEYADNQLVWIEELAANAFDSLSPLKLDELGRWGQYQVRSGYNTVPVHPTDDYHNLRGVQFVNVSGQYGGTGVMAVTLTTSTSTPRPLKIGYENNPTAVFTDPALNAPVVLHVQGADWTSLYANGVVFKYHHNSGGWLLWDEENDTFLNVEQKTGAYKVTTPRYVSIETPLMVTTFDTARAEDYRHHQGVRQDFDRLVRQLEESGYTKDLAYRKAEEIFIELCKKNFPNDQDIRTLAIDWGEVFATVLLGAVKLLLA